MCAARHPASDWQYRRYWAYSKYVLKVCELRADPRPAGRPSPDRSTDMTSTTWTSHHRRGEVLRRVMEAADERRDGVLPTDVDGVAETFGDSLDLLGALQLRWHTRLAG